jgi:hypothetical protein
MRADDSRTLAATTKDRLASVHGQTAQGHRIDPNELAELEGAQRRHRETYEATTNLLGNLRNFIAKLPYNMQLESYVRTGRVRLMPDAKSPQLAVEAIRLEIISHRTQLFSIERAPLPRKEQEAAIAAWVDQQLAKGVPHVSVIGGDVKVSYDGVPFTTPDTVAMGSAVDINAASHQRLIAIGLWLAGIPRDQIVARLVQQLPDPKADTLSNYERRSKVADLKERILQLERDEEATISRYAEDGIHIMRRAEAAPEAVLGIVVGRRARAAA